MRFSDPTGHSGESNEVSDAVHLFLDGAGFFFDGADAINAGLYLAEGDCVNAAISAVAIIPAIGSAATGARWADRARDGARAVDNISDAVRGLDNADEVADVVEGGARYGDEVINRFYHATNTRGANSIIDEGIDLSRGRQNLDFNPSGQFGFYVTRDLEQAEDWARRVANRNNSEAVVLEFAIPQRQLDSLNGRIFNQADELWEQFVVQGRHGTLQHGHDYVEGPMLRNVAGRRSFRRGYPARGGGHQLAIFTDRAVSIFEHHLVDVRLY